MIVLKKTFKFDAAHRLLLHEGLCKNLHGHTWEIVIEATGAPADDGMILDFKELKSIVAIAIIGQFDHSVILHESDPLLPVVRPLVGRIVVLKDHPTCENLSKMFFAMLAPAMPLGVTLTSVEVFESPGSSAKFSEV